MRGFCLFIGFLIFLQPAALAQARRSLHGTLVDADTQQPIVNAEVSILDVGKNITTNSGTFYVDITYANSCKPGYTTNLMIYHPEYGIDLIRITIPDNYQLETIALKKDLIRVFGVVKNRNGQSLEKIKITCQLGNPMFKEPVLETNDFGQFSFEFNRHLVGNQPTVDILVKDPAGKYLDKTITRSSSQGESLEIVMDRINALTPGGGDTSTPNESDSVEMKDLSKRINSILHNNGQRRGGSRVQESIIEKQKFQNGYLIIEGRYNAINFFPYTGKFRCTYNPNTNKIIELEFLNIIDTSWTPVARDLLD